MKNNKLFIESPFPELNSKDIELFEAEYGISLPDDYKQFLISHNGGKTGSRRRFTTNDDTRQGEVESSILVFYPLTNETTENLEGKYELYTNAGVLKKVFLPIGETPRSNLVCMGVVDEGNGYIYHIDLGYDDYLDKKLELEPENIRLIARSFTDFINGLFVSES
ncbi:SMI1/KNR4 family protein [Paenibacillus xylanexedens]|uniref:SMI1/KNR4 family protein n=1 Tax=Paenibacillus xylanexedens TaxID=528191 RepID=UPI00119D0F04|nr:SMI1/KNR4 family protein [Paenibacillus xylanexedens]